jgi:hypothetical protein
MFAPHIATFEMADQMHRERLTHAALLQKVARERATDSTRYDLHVQRMITARRLAATLAGAVQAVTAAVTGSVARPQSAG